MINNNYNSLISRLNETALQNNLQSQKLEDKRLSDDLQTKVLNEQRVENKNRVDLKSPNDPSTQGVTSPGASTESREIFERYTQAGLMGNDESRSGTLVDIKV